jgi:diguanylate cyclase (GGDEF)-like protein/PAS domain S-box-containing protein
LRRDLQRSDDAPSEARDLVDELNGRVAADMLQRARLMLSELVTNSCRHADGPIEVVLSADRDAVEIVVADTGSGFIPEDIRPEQLAEESGRGLLLVDLLSSQWSTGGQGAPWVWVRLEGSSRKPERAVPVDMPEESLLDIRLMIDSVKDFAICALDRTGRVASWRAGAERLTGHSHADIVGCLLSDIYVDGRELDLARTLAAVVNAGRAEEERLLERRDHSRFWANMVITPIYTGADELRGFTVVARDVSWRHRLDANRSLLLDQLQQEAQTDELTGLPNRRRWREELEREMARARRSGNALCVGMVDLDDFKPFNDTHGHQAGDKLLSETAGSWLEAVRATDMLARYGGDEFLLLLPECPVDEALTVVERLRSATSTELTCSVGLAASTGREETETVLHRADSALYEAKRNGRNSIVVADAA